MGFFDKLKNTFKKTTNKVQRTVVRQAKKIVKITPAPVRQNIVKEIGPISGFIDTSTAGIKNKINAAGKPLADMGEAAIEATIRPIAEKFAQQFKSDNKELLEQMSKAGKEILADSELRKSLMSIVKDIQGGNFHEQHDQHRVNDILDKSGLNKLVRKIKV